MAVVNMLQAKTTLSRLVDSIERGAVEEIIIARNGRPAARLVPVNKADNASRRIGLLKGKFRAPSLKELDAQNIDIVRLFGGEG
jgi:prevent-host-death family protein